MLLIILVSSCLVIAAGGWLLVRAAMKTDGGSPSGTGAGRGLTGQHPRARFGDRLDSSFNVLVGVFLGIATEAMVQLSATASWVTVAVITLLFAGVLLLSWTVDWLMCRVFPSEVRPARKQQEKRLVPLPRLLSLSVGFGLGIGLARLGLGDTILALIP